MNGELVVVLYDRIVGALSHGPQGATFTYSAAYQQAQRNPPLSVRLPVSGKTYPTRRVEPFFDGLLPENRETRRLMAADSGVATGLLPLLSAMGWDCPGAVQVTTADRLAAMQSRTADLEPVTDAQIGARLDRLSDRAAGWTQPDEHWSLAGQQSKFALARDRSGWAEAKGSAPTTHIIKPGIGRLLHQALVEHATMRAAASIGVEVAETAYTEFAGRPAIVVTRFDRLTRPDGGVLRIHQEDMAQATGRLPSRKYEADGGPDVSEMAAVLRLNARDADPEITKLADFLLINYAALAPDGHSKNVSIRILPGGDIRMAPLYDLGSALPYERNQVDEGLALAIGGRRRINDIHARQWAKSAAELGIEEDRLRERAKVLVGGFPDGFRDALAEVGTPAAREVWRRAAERVSSHAAMCLSRLDEPGASRAAPGRGTTGSVGGTARGRTTPSSNSGSFRSRRMSESDVELD